MVCFVLANRPFLHPFHAGILQGAEACAGKLKQHLVFVAIECEKETPPGQIVLPPILEEKGWAEGVILTGAVFPNLMSRLEELGLPFVVFGNCVFDSERSRGFNQVRYDGFRAEFEAAEYLIKRGHRTIVFVGDTTYPWFHEQYRGYLKAMRAHKLNPLSFARKEPGSFVEYGSWAAGRLLKRKHIPTAVLAGNDEIAFGLCRSFLRFDVRVPNDVSVIGFDDREIAALMDPPLTTVRIFTQEIGSSCMKLLLEKLHSGSQGVITRWVETELVERESVGCQVTLQAKSRTAKALDTPRPEDKRRA
jgi:DNA-binding LacI/PurR family transcriptional regulator